MTLVKLSFSDRLIIGAKEKGYTANAAGCIFSPSGRKLKGGVTKQGYRTFCPAVYPDGRRGCVLQHRFVAYFFLGEEVFNHRCVRHKNDIPADNRISNLVPGSYQDNTMDMPSEKRKQRSAGAGERIRALHRKLTDEDVHNMRKVREESGTPYHVIAKEFGVATMTAFRAVTKKNWSHL